MAKRKKKLITRRRIVLIGVFAVTLYLFAAGILVWSGLTDELEKADAALVLGNKVFPDGTPSARLAARLNRAHALYAEGYFRLIIVSGGTGVEGYPEGDAMRDYLIARGVPASAILVDNDGVTTGASARNAAKILRIAEMDSVFVVTQYFHVPRSKLAMKREGFSKVYGAHAEFFEWRDIYSTAREVPAYAKYWLRR